VYFLILASLCVVIASARPPTARKPARIPETTSRRNFDVAYRLFTAMFVLELRTGSRTLEAVDAAAEK
jgi:hypothetical protein